MIPDFYSESVSIADISTKEPLERCVTLCEVSTEKRCKTGLTIDPTLCPVSYRDSMVCYMDSTKKRYRTVVQYEPRLRPTTYSDAYYVRPKRQESVFASLVEDRTCKTSEPKWYSTSIHFAKAKDVTCSVLANEPGISVYSNGVSSGNSYHVDDDDNDDGDFNNNIEHHGKASSTRMITKVKPGVTKPGEMVLMLAEEGRQPIAIADTNHFRKQPITCDSYKLCWNGDDRTTSCNGQVNRTRMKIGSERNMR